MSTFLNPAYVFGPVRSRRLGVSLGVNLNPADGKRCSFDCIYCENGRNAERRTASPFPRASDIRLALEQKLAQMAEEGEEPDSITLAGNGEPTLNPEFPQVVDDVLELRERMCPQARVAVLSNGTRAHVREVRDALLRLDDNIQKLDAADPHLVELIDQPAAGYDLERTIEGLSSFGGKVIVQTLFLRGELPEGRFDNSREPYLGLWVDALRRISPRSVMVYTLARDVPTQGLQKLAPVELDAICACVRGLGMECSVSY